MFCTNSVSEKIGSHYPQYTCLLRPLYVAILLTLPGHSLCGLGPGFHPDTFTALLSFSRMNGESGLRLPVCGKSVTVI